MSDAATKPTKRHRFAFDTTPEFVAYMARVAEVARTGTAGLIEQAVIEKAERLGVTEAPPRRKRRG